MLFNTVRLIERDHPDRPKLHEARAKSRIDHLVFRVSKKFATPNAERRVAPRSGMMSGLLQPVLCLGRVCTPFIIDVNVKSSLEPFKSSRVANQVKIGTAFVPTPNSSATTASKSRAHADRNVMQDDGGGLAKGW